MLLLMFLLVQDYQWALIVTDCFVFTKTPLLCYYYNLYFSFSLAYKYVTLCVLTVQNALLILSMRYSRIQTGDMYISTTAVVLSELLKLVVCIIALFILEKKGVVEFAANLFQSVILNWKDTLKLSVPALVYMVQNNLQYIAVSNLDPAVFQVRYFLAPL